jgi:hypothetical protein
MLAANIVLPLAVVNGSMAYSKYVNIWDARLRITSLKLIEISNTSILRSDSCVMIGRNNGMNFSLELLCQFGSLTRPKD